MARIVDAEHDRVSVGGPCHDERLDPARRYGLSHVDGQFVVRDFARGTLEPHAFDCQWPDLLAMFGRAERVAVRDDSHIRINGQNGSRSWGLPEAFGPPSAAQFSFDGQLLWLYSEDAQSLCALDVQTGTLHSPVEPGGLEQLAALWVHPQRPLVVLDTFQPQDNSQFVVVELRDGELHVSEHGHDCHDLSEFIGFDSTGDLGTFIDVGGSLARWSLLTGEEHDSIDPPPLFEGEEPYFESRGTSFDGRISVLWRDQANQTERACLLNNDLQLLYAIDLGAPDDSAYGAELLADGIWRIPFADSTSYYRIR